MAVFKDKNKTSDGRCWYFKVYKKDFNGINKAYKSKRYLTKKEAQEEEALFLLKRDNPNNKPFLLIADDYFKDLSTYVKYSTIYTYIKDYNKHIKPFFERLSVNDISISIYNNWYEWMLKKGLKVKFLNKINSLLKNIFQFAVTNYGMQLNPVVRTFKEPNDKIIKNEDKLVVLTKEEFEKFIDVVDNQLWYSFFTSLFYTGCRKGELVALLWEDIDFSNNTININKTLYNVNNNKATSNKTNTNRQIIMPNKLSKILLDYKNSLKKEYKDFKETWYVFGNTLPLSNTTINRYKHNYFELSGIHEITIHQFRHTHVTISFHEYIKRCKELGIKVDMAKFWLIMSNRMGHTIEVMRRTYMHLDPNIQDEVIDLWNNL